MPNIHIPNTCMPDTSVPDHTSDAYTAWLASPFGQVHIQAEAAAAARPFVEAVQTQAYFIQHPKLAEGIDVAARCEPDWWDRIRGGSVNKVILSPGPLDTITGDALVSKPHNTFYWDHDQFIGHIQVCTLPHEPRPLDKVVQSAPISWDEEALVRLANRYLLEHQRRVQAGRRPLRMGAALYQHLNRQMKQRKADSTVFWVEGTLKRLGIVVTEPDAAFSLS